MMSAAAAESTAGVELIRGVWTRFITMPGYRGAVPQPSINDTASGKTAVRQTFITPPGGYAF
jgi:hypothetical protein